MALYQKFLWGLLAGLALICVKIIGPDGDYVKSLISANAAEWVFYSILSLITIFLGGLSGLFCKESEPARILVFCASFPALLSAATSQTRQEIPAPSARPAEARLAPTLDIGLVTPAFAQNPANDGVCLEGSFVSQIGKAAQDYFSAASATKSYSVVIASSAKFEDAKSKADHFAQLAGSITVYVGCRKPGNAYYPIVAGPNTSQQEAATLMGRIIGEGWAPADSYISSYEYRTPIYTPQ
ncbi:hypothetical protein [Rhizobium halophytocola]|uniref:SPOR domain-containing protein n=1 Tax=Rhizobium halophytocola TaxID=735519 RepID=A0ABS4E3Y4_9HYPH|nr:hypothetical protein [Rhizobium halophytocola]MBP1852661.1 hypothetical protein [Rhizobium halophytocola]